MDEKNKFKIRKNITFYCEDIPERQLISPLYEIFKENKYKVRITNNLSENSEIGYYCSPSTHVKNVNSKFSIISLVVWIRENFFGQIFGIKNLG